MLENHMELLGCWLYMSLVLLLVLMLNYECITCTLNAGMPHYKCEYYSLKEKKEKKKNNHCAFSSMFLSGIFIEWIRIIRHHIRIYNFSSNSYWVFSALSARWIFLRCSDKFKFNLGKCMQKLMKKNSIEVTMKLYVVYDNTYLAII